MPQKSKCKTLPNFNDENKCNQEYPYFGYTKKGFPCCFNKKPKETVELKNKTREENRPEPWVEIDAENLINKINSMWYN